MTEPLRLFDDEGPPEPTPKPGSGHSGRRSRILFAAGAIPLTVACVAGGVLASGTIGVQHTRDFPYRELPRNTTTIVLHGAFTGGVSIDSMVLPEADPNGLARPFARLSRSHCNLPVGDDIELEVREQTGTRAESPSATVDLTVPRPPGAPVVSCWTNLVLYLTPTVAVYADGKRLR